jgi:hypothetical protein
MSERLGIWMIAALALTLGLAPMAMAQDQSQAEPAAKAGTLPDAQIEANVLGALAAEPTLADQPISSSTTFGVVTLSGTVKDQSSKELADQKAATSLGVKKVVDELVVGDTSAVPVVAEGASAMPNNAATADQQAQQAADQGQQQSAPEQQQPAAPSAPQPSVAEQQAAPAQPQYGQQQAPPPPQYGQQPPQPQNAGSYGYAPNGPMHYTGQAGGAQVTVAAQKHVQIRVNQGLSGKRNHPGDSFTGVLMNDVMAGGQVALPRGAEVTGTVVDAKASGGIAGSGELALKLTGITFGGKEYAISSEVWGEKGPNKAGRTAGNAIGLGLMGALIGGAAGGGPGAAIGAIAGGTAGVGVSAASPSAQARVPAESFVNFVLDAPVTVTTVSQDELSRLAGNAPPPPGYVGGPHPRQVYYRPYYAYPY